MITRTLAIACAAVLESLRSRVAPVVALMLVSAVPLVSLLFGDESSRAWMTRNSIVEGLSLLLPLVAVILGAFALKPAVTSGWSLLPARRVEQFLGMAAAGGVMLAAGALLFALGGLAMSLVLDESLVETEFAESVTVRGADSGEEIRAGHDDALSWANPRYGEALYFDAAPRGPELRGTIEYEQIYWYTDAPPSQRQPVEVFVMDTDGRRAAETRLQSRKRVEFSAGVNGDAASIIVVPTDPVFVIGARAESLRLEVARRSPAWSVAALLAVSLGAALMSFLFVISVRARATPATAALAGLLLITALTLLPSLAPARQMAGDRRADMQRTQRTTSALRQVGNELEHLPQLVPGLTFDEFLSGHTVPAQAWLQGMTRFGAGLLFLVPGALLYTRRQIAK